MTMTATLFTDRLIICLEKITFCAIDDQGILIINFTGGQSLTLSNQSAIGSVINAMRSATSPGTTG